MHCWALRYEMNKAGSRPPGAPCSEGWGEENRKQTRPSVWGEVGSVSTEHEEASPPAHQGHPQQTPKRTRPNLSVPPGCIYVEDSGAQPLFHLPLPSPCFPLQGVLPAMQTVLAFPVPCLLVFLCSQVSGPLRLPTSPYPHFKLLFSCPEVLRVPEAPLSSSARP